MEPSEFWSIGDYATIGDLWGRPGRDLAAALDVDGRDAIDLATGTGVTAIALAERGAASVVGVDITPRLLAEARRRADVAGVGITWIEADVASVPLPSASADLVTSTFGLIFAARPHDAVAEARRLVRRDGTVAFTSWSASGLFGDIRRVMAQYFPDAPAPWHESAAGLHAVAGPESVVEEWSFELVVESPESFIGQLERCSAPIVMAAETLGERWPGARCVLVEVVAAAGRAERGSLHVEVPYLVTTLAG